MALYREQIAVVQSSEVETMSASQATAEPLRDAGGDTIRGRGLSPPMTGGVVASASTGSLGAASAARAAVLDGRSVPSAGASNARVGWVAGNSNVRAAQESAILTAVRRQLETMEEKLRGQINRVQQQSDRLREAALQRVDSKMGTMEGLQPKLDRRLAELSGNYKGLSDEMQTQIRRIDQMDTRLWEWRHSMEEEMNKRTAELEQRQEKIGSQFRVEKSNQEDQLRRLTLRLNRLEQQQEERQVLLDGMGQDLQLVGTRLTEVEDLSASRSAIAPFMEVTRQPAASDMVSAADAAAVVSLETRVTDLAQKMDQLLLESHDVHGRLEAQEERLRTLRTLCETKDEHYRWLNERVERADWEGRFKELHSLATSVTQQQTEDRDSFRSLQSKVEFVEQSQEKFSEQLRQVRSLGSPATQSPEPSRSLAEAYINEEFIMDMRDCMTKVSELDRDVGTLRMDVTTLQSDAELAPRVGKLVEQLGEVAPKVVQLDASMREVLEKVGRLEVQAKMAEAGDNVSARLNKLEDKLERFGGLGDVSAEGDIAPLRRAPGS